MTNHNPVITSSAATGSFSEDANTTGSTVDHVLSGTMNFTDSDHSDTHSTTTALKTAVWSGGSTLPSGALTKFQAGLTSSIQSDSNGAGKLKWAFSEDDRDFDFLAKDETLVLTYEITLNDNHGGSTKQTVKITVTGTDDRPVFATTTGATLSEQANHSLSLSPDTAHIALQFTDVDLNNTGHTASVLSVSATGNTSGILPGSLGTAELMSFFDINNVVKTAGSSNGTVNTTFSAPDLAFDYLAAGEQLKVTYVVQIDDHKGGLSTQNVAVTVNGTNDAPFYICGPETAHLVEGQHLSPSGDLTASGDLLFTDLDLSDTHTVSTTVTASRSGGGPVLISNADLLAAFSTSVLDSTGHLLGDVDWHFALDNDDVAFLNSGETLTATYTVKVSDNHGGFDTQTVTITVLGTNDPVVITSGPEAGSVAEFTDTTGSTVQNTTTPVPTDAIAFTDTDLGDTHTVATSVVSAVWSGGPAVPSGTSADLPAALLTTLHDSTGTGSGSVDWTFSIADRDLDFLADGETLTVTYKVAVSDGPTTASQNVTITATGTNDAVTVTSGPDAGAVAEQPGVTGSSAPDATSSVTALTFSDPDLSDTHSVTVTLTSTTYSVEPEFIPFQTFFDLQTALSTTLHDSTGTGLGSIDWSFSLPDQDLDFLGGSDTLTIVYDITVADGSTSSTQQVTITATGAQDSAQVHPFTADLSETSFQDAGNVIGSGNAIFEAGDNGVDFNNTMTVTAVNGSAGNVGNPVAGSYGSLILLDDGSYVYLANAAADVLQVGDHVSDGFNFTVTDSYGHATTTTLTVNVDGVDDAPLITAADVTGLMIEDAGPNTIVNGGFETGNLNGWSSSSSSISVEFFGIGGDFGNYSASLGPTATTQTLSQTVATTPGQHYLLSFYLLGDSEASSNSFAAYWDGNPVPVVSISDDFGGFARYTVDVVASNSSTSLQFAYADDGIGMTLDQVLVSAANGTATESSNGNISFTDIETSDTHTASFVPAGPDYVGTFSLDPITESSGSGSTSWHFTVDNSDIQFLSDGEALTQTYTVFINDNNGASGTRDVSVTMIGTNDAPTTVSADHVITDADVNGGIFLPTWTLTANDVDPDHLDTLGVNSITSETGGDATAFTTGVIWFDDAALDGSFTYNTTDGHAVSPGSGTVTIDNNAASTTTLSGTGGDDIIVATVGGETLNGGGGNDILIGNSGTHVLTGGSGNDIFAFELVPDQTPTPANTITDFNNVSDHDMIAISAAAFGGGLTPGQDVSENFESSGDADFFGSRFHYDESNQTLYFSSDGTTASAIVVVQVQPGVFLTGHDLMIV